MEDKTFLGKTKMYQLFRKYDQDGDGFISYADFQARLKQMKIEATQPELNAIMKLVDQNNQGYLTFTEFSKVFSPSMSAKLVNVEMKDSTLPNHQPSQAMHQQNIK